MPAIEAAAVTGSAADCVRAASEVAAAGAELILFTALFDQREQMERLAAEVLARTRLTTPTTAKITTPISSDQDETVHVLAERCRRSRDTTNPPMTMPIAMPRSSARRLSSLAGASARRGTSAIRASTRTVISSSTRSRNDATTASLYSGPSSSWAAAAARISAMTWRRAVAYGSPVRSIRWRAAALILSCDIASPNR